MKLNQPLRQIKKVRSEALVFQTFLGDNSRQTDRTVMCYGNIVSKEKKRAKPHEIW